jgi:hypothetical protein
MIHARKDYMRIQDPEGKIPEDEPVFLIRGQDAVGAEVVRFWGRLNAERGGDLELSQTAKAQAALMDAWPTKKLADAPAGAVEPGATS